MTAVATEPVGRLARFRQGLWIGAALLVALVALTAIPDVPGLTRLHYAWLDVCQYLAPRVHGSDRTVIVAVDDTSLDRHGQWPWPRTLLARLVGLILDGRAAAVGLDVVMPEPDRLSPPGLPALVPTIGPALAARLAEVPSNDSVLAATLRGRPVVLGVIGLDGGAEPGSRPPARIVPTRVTGGAPAALRHFDALLRSVEAVDAAARGQGLLNADLDGGAVRRLALVSEVNGVIVPAMALEMLRVSDARPEITLRVEKGAVRTVGTGEFVAQTQDDASVWLRYARHPPGRFLSAADVLAGTVPRDVFRDRLVLVGVTALGLSDRRPIPGTGDTMDSVEIHAEAIESLLDHMLLARPWWGRWVEGAFVLLGGVLVIVTVPVKRARAAAFVLAPMVIVAFAASFAAYQWASRLVNASTPSLALTVLFVTMLSVTLAEAERQRRTLRLQVEQQREAAARFEGELSAARRIQMGILPAPALLATEPRVSLYAVLEPAREVGGDLYDFFLLERDRLFFLLGDVSGKGLPGSLFMAVSKSLYKSTALRRSAGVAMMMREANAEISRDNSESMFVTVFAATLDLATGTLEYCNAGHDQPYLIPRGGAGRTQLAEGGGLPLCVMDDYPYEAAAHQLQPGDTLCLVTDGVTEARNAAGEFFGRARLEAVLSQAAGAGTEALALAVRNAVADFVAGSEPADDLAILVVRWQGPSAVSGR